MEKRYFWLKLKEDFFNQPEVGILERGKRGKEVLLFYLKLLTLSIGEEGRLRISGTIPYDIPNLAAVTGNTVPLVTLAIERLSTLNLLIQEEDGTYFLPRVKEMQGTETYWAQKKREQKEKRVKEDLEIVGNFPKNSNEFPTSPSKRIEKEKEKEIEIESEIEKEGKGAVVVGEGQDGTDLRVELSMEQRKVLVDQMGYDRLVDYLEKMDAFTESKGRAFKDPYQTILKWYQEDCG